MYAQHTLQPHRLNEQSGGVPVLMTRGVQLERCSPYWPWGRPACGAPNPQAVRRRKLSIYSQALHPVNEPVTNKFPRLEPIPMRVADPLLRFQFKPEVRKSIDDHWRYSLPYNDKAAYKLQLDRLVEEKSTRLKEEMRDEARQQQQLERLEAPWGRAGPGGQQWRSPRQVGLNFLHSLGWTSEKALRRLENQLDLKQPAHLMLEDSTTKKYNTPEEHLTGGVELVPLLARRRSFKKHMQLPSTDVTRMSKTDGEKHVSWKDVRDPHDYLRDLNSQVNQKQVLIQEAKKEDLVESRKHFETWCGLWGRPGHGAPKQVKVKENLQKMLYPRPPANS